MAGELHFMDELREYQKSLIVCHRIGIVVEVPQTAQLRQLSAHPLQLMYMHAIHLIVYFIYTKSTQNKRQQHEEVFWEKSETSHAQHREQKQH